MKNKKILLAVLSVVLIGILVGMLFVGFRAGPTVDHALRISALLQPVLDAKNHTMHIAVSAEFGGEPFGVESDIYLVTEEGESYLAVERNGTAVYVAENVLFLENGKAFRLGDKMQTHAASYEDLLPRIGALYDVLKITAEETESGTVYEITVTGAQVDTLLAVAALEAPLPVEGIKTLNLSLAEKNGKLEKISFSGNADMDGTSVRLNVTLFDFRILASGDYPIPDAVKQSAAAVDPDGLFSLTEDLYRLVLALAPFADMESIDGILALVVDCGPIQLDMELRLSDLQTASTGPIDLEQLRALPEILGLMCTEGDISCTQKGNAYVYTLELDQQGIQQLARMILPEFSGYGGKLTEGSVTVMLEDNAISSMNVSIEGKISALIAQVPMTVNAEFSFD